MDRDLDRVDGIDDEPGDSASPDLLGAEAWADRGWALSADHLASFAPAGCCCQVQLADDSHPIQGYDTDGDGRVDAIALDTDGDGWADVYYVDEDGDGIWDTIRDTRGNWIGVPARPPEPIPIPTAPPAPVDPASTPSSVMPPGQPQATITLFLPDSTPISLPAVALDGTGVAKGVRIDADGDGFAELLILDRDGNGIADAVLIDRDGAHSVPTEPIPLPASSPAHAPTGDGSSATPAPQHTTGGAPAFVPAPDPTPATSTPSHEGYIPDPVPTGNTVADVYARAKHNIAEAAAGIWHDLFPGDALPSHDAGMIFANALDKLPRDSPARAQIEELLDGYNRMIRKMDDQIFG